MKTHDGLRADDLNVNDPVKLRSNVLQRHARTVPAHCDYTTAQFAWRETIDKLEGVTGIVERKFENSQYLNVRFGEVLIGINASELVKA